MLRRSRERWAGGTPSPAGLSVLHTVCLSYSIWSNLCGLRLILQIFERFTFFSCITVMLQGQI